MPSRLASGLGALLLMLACVPGAMPARADDQPPLGPTRDVAVTYHVQDPQGATRIVHMYFDAADQRVHIDMSSQPGFLVIDHKAGEVTMVNSATHSYVQVPAPPAMGNLMFRAPDLRLVRQGTRTVAGISCTVWEMSQGGNQGGDACITGDGVVLSGRPANAPSPDTGIEAVSVAYGPQPATLFAAPSGYQRIQPTLPPPGVGAPAPKSP
ncbi:MAG TPA: hypothetical protein VMA37_12485 [Acetobacteraceae bacterium]|nr:hypothetical protein [Acetobacteraceae bacterium]